MSHLTWFLQLATPFLSLATLYSVQDTLSYCASIFNKLNLRKQNYTEEILRHFPCAFVHFRVCSECIFDGISTGKEGALYIVNILSIVTVNIESTECLCVYIGAGMANGYGWKCVCVGKFYLAWKQMRVFDKQNLSIENLPQQIMPTTRKQEKVNLKNWW